MLEPPRRLSDEQETALSVVYAAGESQPAGP